MPKTSFISLRLLVLFHLWKCVCMFLSHCMCLLNFLLLLIRIQQSSIFPSLVLCFSFSTHHIFYFSFFRPFCYCYRVRFKRRRTACDFLMHACCQWYSFFVSLPQWDFFDLTCSCPIPCSFILLYGCFDAHTNQLDSRLNPFRGIILKELLVCVLMIVFHLSY